MPQDVLNLIEEYHRSFFLFDLLHIEQKLSDAALMKITEANAKLGSYEGISSFYQKCVTQIISPPFVFWSLRQFLQHTAECLDCYTPAPSELSFVQRFVWDIDHCDQLLETVQKEVKIRREIDFTKFINYILEKMHDNPAIPEITDHVKAREKWKELTNVLNTHPRLKHLESIYFPSKKIALVPNEIEKFTKLYYLGLPSNKITYLPKELFPQGNNNLIRLDISHNELFYLPEEIGNAQNLEELKCDYNRFLTSLPANLTKLTRLTTLWASGNNFSFLPKPILALTNLTTLGLSANYISKLPNEFFNLKKLNCFFFSHNLLMEIPKAVENLTCLRILDVKFNSLKRLPNEIVNLNSLGDIECAYNHIESLPENFEKMTNLHTLFIRSNNLTSLPPTITMMTNLRNLNFMENPISPSPTLLSTLTQLQSLYL